MEESEDKMIDALSTLVEATNVRQVDELERQIRHVLYELVRREKLNFGPDYQLGETALEIRVHQILESMRLPVCGGREGKEDLVISVPDFAVPSLPMVLEVKSSRNQTVGLAPLRQLDDWVFDLSNEGRNRKLGIDNQGRHRSWGSKGAIQAPPFGSNPHKGVLVCNYLLGTQLEKRVPLALDTNEAEFVEAHSLCVISLPCLLSWEKGCSQSPETAKKFWSSVQQCVGLLSPFCE